MKCIQCNHEQTKVTNSRLTRSATQTWRRRTCEHCGFTFTTHEIIDLSHLIVIKKSGKAVRYVRAKLFAGLYGATIGIMIHEKELFIDKVTSDVETAIIKLNRSRIHSAEIGEIVLSNLLKTNVQVFMRFIARYKKIETESQMFKELRKYSTKS